MAYFASYCWSAPEGFRRLLPRRSYFWIGNETIFIMFIGFWWRLHWHVRVVSSYSWACAHFCVVYHKRQKEERGQKSVGLMSPPSLIGPILFYRSHSAILELSLNRWSTVFACRKKLLFSSVNSMLEQHQFPRGRKTYEIIYGWRNRRM